MTQNTGIRSFAWACVCACAIGLFAAATALAGPVLTVEGALFATGGGAASDGSYVMTFALYSAADAQESVWKETQIDVKVEKAHFSTLLGQGTVLSPELFSVHPELWIGVRIGVDPELPRVRIGATPLAFHALTAAALTGKIEGKQLVDGSVPATALGFAAAGAKTPGGPAANLACTGCVTLDHLANGVMTANNVAVAAGGISQSVQGVLDALTGALTVSGKRVGIGKAPAAACGLDLASGVGTTCIDGAPAVMVRIAANANEMQSLKSEGQIVYRKDTGGVYVLSKSLWREVMYKPVCGDGAQEALEQCDDGANNANLPDKCRTTCLKPACGDGIPDTGEQCDDGANNANLPDKCRPTCKKATCGDLVVDSGEQCDDGNATTTDGCVACVIATCGDGYVWAGKEDCDDKNQQDGDGCSKTCKTCGDGTCQPDKNENANTCPGDCPIPVGTDPSKPAEHCKAVLAGGTKTNGEYWLKWGGMASAIQVYCNQTEDFGTGVVGGFMLHCGSGKSSISGAACSTSLAWSSMKEVDYRTHVMRAPTTSWWMSLEMNQAVKGSAVPCDVRMRVKSDICPAAGGWGKTDSSVLSGYTCAGFEAASGGIRITGGGADTMANGWAEITHGGGLGPIPSYVGAKHTPISSGGNPASPSEWEGYVR
ncbi:MAG: DUF4215 domain-containing protein [Myxococcota bacterium]